VFDCRGQTGKSLIIKLWAADAREFSSTNFNAQLQLFSPTASNLGTPLNLVKVERSYMRLQIPPGAGSQWVEVQMERQWSNTIFISYSAPIVTGVSQQNFPVGSFSLVVFGSNFGPPQHVPVVKVGSVQCQVHGRNHTAISITCPEGRGTNQLLSVQLLDLTSSLDGAVFITFDAPTISRVRGCAIDLGNTTTDCPLAGKVALTLEGNNFGPSVECCNSTLSVRVGSFACDITSVTNTKVICSLPAGFGTQNVTLAYSSYAVQFSDAVTYKSPRIIDGSLRLNSQTINVMAPSMAGGDLVSFRADNAYSAVSPTIVRYGITVNDNTKEEVWKSCTVQTINSTHITCTTSPGRGKGLRFKVFVGSIPSNLGTDTYSYPAPTITFGSLLLPLLTVKSSTVTGTKSEKEALSFEGTNFGAFSQDNQWEVKVYLNRHQENFACKVDAVTSNDTKITCLTGPGFGEQLKVSVCVGPQPFTQCFDSNNTFTYPTAPRIYSVTGCPTNRDNKTFECPTEGKSSITITGQYFTSKDAQVSIGGRPCLDVVHSKVDTELTCILPSGTGVQQAVTVSLAKVFSSNFEAVSYAPPLIQRITGCPGTEGVSTSECPRAGELQVTIFGKNFGDKGADVLVGGDSCNKVQHIGHTQLTCLLPKGTELKVDVAVTQQFGLEVSGNGTYVSYVQCTKGTFAEIGIVQCQSCSVGRYNALPSQSSCLLCPGGKFANVSSSSACAACTKGKYSSPGSPSCLNCPAGKYMSEAVTTKTACSICAVGTIAPELGQSECDPCPPGKFANTDSNMTMCSECKAGTYTDSFRQGQCKQCQPGSFNTGTAQTSCNPCQQGTFSGSPGLTACTNCTVGKYADTNQKSACAVCEPGKYASSEGLDLCVSCKPGKFGSPNVQNPSSCKSCAVGKFTSQVAQTACRSCEQGHFANETGTFQCTPCSPGKAQTQAGQISCDPCDAGRFQNENGKAECIDCPSGSAVNLTGQVSCKACSRGKYSINTQECAKCSIGKFNNRIGADCLWCPPGFFTASEGQEECSRCPGGTYSSGQGASECTPCPNGTYSILAAVQCTPCERGSFSTGNVTACSLCDTGTYQSRQEQSECDPCPVGTFADTKGNSQCPNCPAGKFGNASGAVACIDCPVGKSKGSPNEAQCSDCIPGRFADKPGTVVCDECAPGTFGSDIGSATCSPCPSGSFQMYSGRVNCTACEVGRAVNLKGQKECPYCQAGKFQNLENQTQCQLCPAGKVERVQGSTACQSCGTGYFMNQEGQQKCALCPQGYFTNFTGQSACNACGLGFHQSAKGQNKCEPCPTGSFAGTEGQAYCSPCDPGTFSNASRTSRCFDCELGRYQTFPGKSICSVCGVGRYAGSLGSSECIACAPGNVINATGASNCEKCPPGRYQSEASQVSCNPTNKGYFAPAGSSQPKQCFTAHVAPFDEMGECLPCDSEGTNSGDFTRCICNSGFYGLMTVSGGNVSVICSACPTGTNCSALGVEWSNISLFPGYWRADDGLDTPIYQCDNLKHCAGGKLSGDQSCLGNRMGPICRTCMPNFKSSFGVSECVACKSSGQSISEVVLLGLAFAIGMFAIYSLIHFTDRSLQKQAVEFQLAMEVNLNEEYQTETIDSPSVTRPFDSESIRGTYKEGSITRSPSVTPQPAAFASSPRGAVLTHGRQTSLASPRRNVTTTELLGDEDSTKASVDYHVRSALAIFDRGVRLTEGQLTYKLKIIFGFYQILTNLADVQNVPWPSLYLDFIDYFRLVNFDFIPWNSLGCLSNFDYFSKFLFTALLPIGAFVLLLIFYLFPLWVCDKRDMSDHGRFRLKHKQAQGQFIKMALFTSFLLYPTVSRTIFSILNCRDIAGKTYLSADFSLECYTERHYNYLYFSIAMIVLYPFGVPFVSWLLVRRHRDKLLDPLVRMKYGLLYAAYNVEQWYFELIDMAHKLVLTSLLVFVEGELKVPVAMCVILAYTLAILIFRPYLRKGDDRLHLFAQCILLNICLMSRVIQLKKYDYVEPAVDVFLSLILIALNVLLICGFLLITTRNLVKLIRQWQKKRALKKKGIDPLQLIADFNSMKREKESAKAHQSYTFAKLPDL